MSEEEEEEFFPAKEGDSPVWIGSEKYVRADRIEALEAENERLRDALKSIIRMTDEIVFAPMASERWADRIEDVARAALNAKEEG